MEKQILELLVDMKTDLNEVKKDVKTLNAKVDENTEDIKELKTKVDENTEDIKELKGDVKELKTKVDENTKDIKDIKNIANRNSINITKILEVQVKQLKYQNEGYLA